MKASAAIAASAVLLAALIGFAPTHVAAKSPTRKHWADDHRDRRHHTARRRFTQRERDRLPIRITQPPGTGHYVFDDYPEWAARAFQPNLNR